MGGRVWMGAYVVVPLLRLRAQEARPKPMPPVGAPSEFVAWTDLNAQLPTADVLEEATLSLHMWDPMMVALKIVISYMQVSYSSFLHVHPAPLGGALLSSSVKMRSRSSA